MLSGWTLLAVVLAPAFGSLVAAATGRARWAAGGQWAAGAALAATAAAVAVAGPVEAGMLRVDALGLVLLGLVHGIGLVVARFAERSLRHEPTAGRFAALGAALVSATSLIVAGDDLVTVVIGWVLAGVTTVALLATGDTPPSRHAARSAAVAFAVGDLFLVGGALVAVLAWGNPALGADGGIAAAAGAASPAAVTAVGMAVAVAALSRAGLVPFHHWLAASVGAPTPVSALLHAGVVNAGGILLVRLSGLTAEAPAALALLVAGGTATMVAGTVRARVRPDVKGRLAASTAAQMGFMIVTAAVGLLVPAVLHLVAHGAYKASLFLGSGLAVRSARRRERLHARPTRTGPAPLVAAALPAAVVAAAWAVAGGPLHLDGAVAAYLAAAVAVAVLPAARHSSPRVLVTTVAATLAAAAATVGAGAVGHALLSPAVDDPGALPTWILVAAGLPTAAVALADRTPARLRDALYTRAFLTGHPRPGRLLAKGTR